MSWNYYGNEGVTTTDQGGDSRQQRGQDDSSPAFSNNGRLLGVEEVGDRSRAYANYNEYRLSIVDEHGRPQRITVGYKNPLYCTEMNDTDEILPNVVASSRFELADMKPARTEVPRTPPVYDRQNYNGANLYNNPVNPVLKTLDNLASSVETVYFRDGRRRIDYVLAYEEGDPSSNLMDERRALKRQIFLENILMEGVHIEIEDKEQSQDGKTYFVKIHAPWEVLARYAELMNMKMPIKELDEEEERETKDSCDCLLGPFEYDRRLIPDEPQYFTCAFNRERANQFIIKHKDTFFSSAQRSRIVWEILLRTRYDSEQKEKVGVVRLINNGSYTAAFPLHEPHQSDKEKKATWQPLESYEGQVKFKNTSKEWITQDTDNTRMLLYKEWARAGCWYKKQPLNLIRKYFGDKIGIYFAWLGFYTTMLIPAAFVGLVCFLYGVITLNDSYPAKEICDQDGVGNLTICPLCDQSCPYQNLSDSCAFAKVTYLFDNPATVFFSIFMSFWATSFLEIWKRTQAKISWEWDLVHLEEEEEPARPEFEANVRTQRKNPVTKGMEPFLPAWNRTLRIVAASSAVLFMLFVVVAAVFGVIVYRIAVVTVLHGSNNDFVRDNAKITVAVTSATINLIIILILDRIYKRIAVWLTNMEQPRTQTEYEDSFTFKMFLFQSINFYSSLIYIAFFKGRFYEHPGDPKYRLWQIGTRLDQCDPAGCLFELCVQLAIIMVGKQMLNNCMELMFPKLQNWWRARKSQANTKQLYSRWEKDYDLEPLDNMTLFNEYLEMVIQYGFVTIFVAAFPLAPLFALLNNVVEIRLDAYKFVTQVRRPMAARANNIGAWLQILHAVSMFAVIVNAFVIAYTSGFIPRMVYQYQYSIENSYNLTGYIQNSLSEFATSDFIPNVTGPNFDLHPELRVYNVCWYRDYRNPPNHTNKYDRSLQYWHVFAARLAFVVIFEHLVFFLTGFMAYIIPDMPQNVKVNIRREKLLAKEALYAAELQKLQAERKRTGRYSEEMQNLDDPDGTQDRGGYVPSHTPEPGGNSPTPPSPTGRERRI